MRVTKDFQDALALALEEKYGENYQEIVSLNNVALETAMALESRFTIARTGEKVYPEYYGGMYINDDQKLVLQVVKDEVPSVGNSLYSSYASTTNYADNEILEYVDYSFNELKNVYDKVNEYFTSDVVDYDNLVSNSIDPLLNRVVIKLIDNTPEKQNEFREKIIDSEMLVFEQGERKIAQLNPGDAVSTCSLGFRARLNGQAGFVTAGHCAHSHSAIGTSFGGTGTIKQRVFSGNADAMFVQTSTSISNSIPNWNLYPAITLNGSSLPVVGQMVGKYGKTTGATTGTIRLAYTSDYITAVATEEHPAYITDMYEASVLVQPGDSGAPVFTLTASNNLMGTVSAGNGDGTFTPANPSMYGIKVGNIISRLGITRY